MSATRTIDIAQASPAVGDETAALRAVLERAAVLVATAVVAVCAVAMLVWLLAGDQVAAWAKLPFSGIPNTLSWVIKIAAYNIRIAGTFAIGALVLAAADHQQATPAFRRRLRWCLDLVLGAIVAFNLLALSIPVAGYGPRGLAALLPHGPVELAGFTAALAAYVAARRGTLTISVALRLAGLCLGCLLAAAILEVFAA